MYSTEAMPQGYHSSMILYLTIGKFSFLLFLSSLFFLKEQYPESAHAQNFEVCSSCREIKRCEKSNRTVKNPFASRLAEFDTTLKRLRISDQWYIVPFKFRFGRNRDVLALGCVQTDRNIVGQQLPTLLDVTWRCCVRLHTLLHVVVCCCEKCETGQSFQPKTPNISFVPRSSKRSATMLDPFAQLF